MIFQYKHISRHATVFRAMTGLSVREFDSLAEQVLPLMAKADRHRLDEARPQRQREAESGPETGPHAGQLAARCA